MQTDTRMMTTPDEMVPFSEPIPEGCIPMGQIDEMICDYDYFNTGDPERAKGCGGIYYQRCYTTPNNLVFTERTPCSCMLRLMVEKEQERQQSQLKRHKQNLERMITNQFASYDLLRDEAYNHMALQNFKAANPEQQELLNQLNNFTPGKASICLYGEAGRGKTHLALGVARAARQNGSTTLALKSIDLLTRIKRTWDRKDDGAEIEIMRSLKLVDVLVIDDIGMEKSSEWVLSKFYEIIDYRHGRRTTIYTTNLTGGEMREKEGMALVSRIWGSELRLLVEGIDYRIGGRR